MIDSVAARLVAGQFLIYDLEHHQTGTPFTPVLSIALPEVVDSDPRFAAHPELDGVAYVTTSQLVRLDADGQVRWRIELGLDTGRPNAYASCRFSHDGKLLWVYLPDAMMNRGDDDRLLLVDESGTIVDEIATNSVGHGASMYEHQDGSVLVEIGEGQDGMILLRCRANGGHLVAEHYPWSDRCLIGLSPDGTTMMTVDHSGQEDVSFHTYPDGEVLFSLTPPDFGEQREEAIVEWAGGYLDARTAVVVLYGEDEDTEQEWYQHYLVDLVDRAPAGRWDVVTDHAYELDLLGDGTWLQPSPEGLRRHQFQ
jgi:hypothetical protein